LIRFAEDSFGGEEKKLMVVIAFWLGLRLVSQLNLGDLASPTCNEWDRHFECVGSS
jgi:hypothetical protein